MPQPTTHVIAIGNAIVDVMAPCADSLIEQLGLVRGGMTLVDTARAQELYDAMGPAREISGGSAANTLAGLAALGSTCAFIGQVANDQLGEVFAHDIRAGGISFATPARSDEPPTARCLIFVTPDGQRTMNTYLGASQFLPAAALDEAAIAGIVETTIAELGASSGKVLGAKEMGQVMKAVMVKLTGQTVDGKVVSQLVKAKLGA